MGTSDKVNDGISRVPRWDKVVTMEDGSGEVDAGESIASIRAEMESAFRAAQDRVAARLARTLAVPAGSSQVRARDLLKQSRARARALAGVPATQVQEAQDKPEIAIQDLHTLERLLSYVRHSVVRACFYNLKLFCPSLVDEYDEHVKSQILTNLDQLEAARAEVERFFDAALLNGEKVGAVFPEIQRRTLERMERLARLSIDARDRLDDEPVRNRFASRAPALIDGVMDALQEVQAELDGRKLVVSEVMDQAVALMAPIADQAGLRVTPHMSQVSRVFGDRARLLNCFSELIANAAKYSGGTELSICVNPLNKGGGGVEVVFEDNGRGMTQEDLASALTRGSSRAGTGEGLPMVVQTVEAEHLGEFEITSVPGRGSRAEVRLPVKVEARTRTEGMNGS